MNPALFVIADNIRADYSKLWHARRAGDTIELVTPYTHPDRIFIQVFLTERDGRYIASDGGLLHYYSKAPDLEAHRNRGGHIIKTTQSSHAPEIPFYFVECPSPVLISAMVFDLCNFLFLESWMPSKPKKINA